MIDLSEEVRCVIQNVKSVRDPVILAQETEKWLRNILSAAYEQGYCEALQDHDLLEE